MRNVFDNIARSLPEPRRRRPWLAATLTLSLAAHIGLAAMLWVEQKALPARGAVVSVEIVADAGAARSNAATTATGGPARTAEAAKPETAPTPKSVEAPEAPRAVRAPAPNAPAMSETPKPPAPERAQNAPRPSAELQRPDAVPPIRTIPPAEARKPPMPEIVAARPVLQVALRRPARVPPSPAKRPRRADPAPSAHAADAGHPPRKQTAAAPIVAADAAPASGPDNGTTPPRYGFGSVANPIPRYPDSAREQGWEGRVLLIVVVSADGRAESLRIKESSGHGILDAAAVDAVRRWRFEPARRAGIAIPGTATVPIRFRLED